MTRSVWINGYEGLYKIYDDGRVQSFHGKVPKFLKPSKDTKGYFRVGLYRPKVRPIKIHKIVAKHFVPGYQPGLQVNHKNGVKTDNSAANLEWVTPGENTRHAIKNGLMGDIGEATKKPVVGFHVESGQRFEFESGIAAAAAIGGKRASICNCLHGRRKSHRGYRWSYA